MEAIFGYLMLLILSMAFLLVFLTIVSVDVRKRKKELDKEIRVAGLQAEIVDLYRDVYNNRDNPNLISRKYLNMYLQQVYAIFSNRFSVEEIRWTSLIDRDNQELLVGLFTDLQDAPSDLIRLVERVSFVVDQIFRTFYKKKAIKNDLKKRALIKIMQLTVVFDRIRSRRMGWMPYHARIAQHKARFTPRRARIASQRTRIASRRVRIASQRARITNKETVNALKKYSTQEAAA